MKAFPEYLRAAGYYTTNASKTDYNLGTPVSVWDEVSQDANRRNRPNPDQPFFSVFNITTTHQSQLLADADEPLVTDPAGVTVPPYFPDTPVVRQTPARVYDNSPGWIRRSRRSCVSSTWIGHYRTIALANTVLDRTEGATVDPARAGRIRGEALFLRGLMYYNLVRVFGPVPLIVQETSSVEQARRASHERASVDEVYARIIGDLREAASLLPPTYSGVDQGRATSGAANALLGGVLLTRKSYPAAQEAFGKVISSGRYRLLSNYADVFNPANPLHTEAIFTVLYQANGQGDGSPFSSQFVPQGYPGITANTTKNRPTPTLVSSYETGDARFLVTVGTQFVDTRGRTVRQLFAAKYLSPTPYPNQGNDDWPVVRYADVLLMQAEILNEMGRVSEALGYLNMVRERAKVMTLSGLSQGQLREAILRERMRELAFEGHRWFDLLRMGRAIPAMAAATPAYQVEPHELLFPIPQDQIDISGRELQQNPGY